MSKDRVHLYYKRQFPEIPGGGLSVLEALGNSMRGRPVPSTTNSYSRGRLTTVTTICIDCACHRMTKMSLSSVMEPILHRGLLSNLIGAEFIGGALWMPATFIDNIEVANAAFREKFITVQYGDSAQAGKTSCAVFDVSIDVKPAGRVAFGLFGGVEEALDNAE